MVAAALKRGPLWANVFEGDGYLVTGAALLVAAEVAVRAMGWGAMDSKGHPDNILGAFFRITSKGTDDVKWLQMDTAQLRWANFCVMQSPTSLRGSIRHNENLHDLSASSRGYFLAGRSGEVHVKEHRDVLQGCRDVDRCNRDVEEQRMKMLNCLCL